MKKHTRCLQIILQSHGNLCTHASAQVLDEKFKDEAEAEAAKNEVTELVTKARELLGTAKTAVLAKIQEKVTAGESAYPCT